jgi:hypothetical protein
LTGSGRRTRFTLKADPARSFQPQEADGTLIDIVPFLRDHGVSLDSLRTGMRAGTGSQPMTIPDAVAEAIVKTLEGAPVTLHGLELRAIRRGTPDLESQGHAGEDEPEASAPQVSRHGARCGC